jgi:predicted nuclease of restriction endonuclease-like (RecB) superfamily
MKKKQIPSYPTELLGLEDYRRVQSEIVDLLTAARSASIRSVNALMTATYWEVGKTIVESEQKGKRRAEYGDALIKRLAKDLTLQFGRGFGVVNLSQMKKFYLAWAPSLIFQTPSEKSYALPDLATKFPLPWSAYVRLLSIRSGKARAFYESEALRSGWSIRQLDRQIGSQFYERIELSKNKAAILKTGEAAKPEDFVAPEEAIKDPFVLEFLNLKDEYSESDLEDALIHHLTDFLLELGDDFAFLGRQKRLRIDDTWFRVDLLFYHRRLKCLVVIDLKVGRFSHVDAGHWMKAGENPPVGLILCAEKGMAEAHYALDGLPNKVIAAEYQMVLPAERILAAELKRSGDKLSRRRKID